MGSLRWIAGILGVLFGGGIFGGVLGYAVGSVLEKMVKKEYSNDGTSGDFVMALLILSAAIMKADRKVMRSELNFVKDFLIKNFGEEGMQNRLDILKQLLDRNIDIYKACEKIRIHFPYSNKLQLIHYLFGIAVADAMCNNDERDMMERIANLIGLSAADYKTIEAMYFDNVDKYYTILQVSRSASDREIKKAYRNLCLKYHPDKVANLGEKAQQSAKERLQQINEAYEKIKAERNIV